MRNQNLHLTKEQTAAMCETAVCVCVNRFCDVVFHYMRGPVFLISCMSSKQTARVCVSHDWYKAFVAQAPVQSP